MKILVTFAVEAEMGSWQGAQESFEDIRIVRTGIGMRGPQNKLRQELAGPVNICIASGLAGSLKQQYPVGSVVVARGIKFEGNSTIVSCDGGLVDAAVRCGAQPIDFLYTSSGIANSGAERKRLAGLADAVDMETYHVLSEARRAGVPAVAVRAISDSPDRKLPVDFTRVVTGNGQMAWPRLIGELIKHPGSLPAFVRFGIDSSAAIRNLTTFLDRYVSFLRTNEPSFRTPAEQISR
jgi:adenosylhomocysteine nucleosidase